MQFGGYQVQAVSDLEASELIVSVLVSFFGGVSFGGLGSVAAQ